MPSKSPIDFVVQCMQDQAHETNQKTTYVPRGGPGYAGCGLLHFLTFVQFSTSYSLSLSSNALRQWEFCQSLKSSRGSTVQPLHCCDIFSLSSNAEILTRALLPCSGKMTLVARFFQKCSTPSNSRWEQRRIPPPAPRRRKEIAGC